jgi:glycerophosphoryl diester phosphodiesterase
MTAPVPAVIAHRGASRAAPENTLEAFRLARRLGADAVELDVRRTADGEPAVHHDAHLPDGRALHTVASSDLPPHVPLLPEALDACGGLWVNVELKNWPDDPDFDPDLGLADLVVDLVLARADEGRVLVSCFHLPTLDRVRALAGGRLRTAWLVVGVDDQTVPAVVAHGHQALHPWFGVLEEARVAEARRAGLDVNPWTCDDPDAMRRLAGWGVTGICTNVPDVARRALEG